MERARPDWITTSVAISPTEEPPDRFRLEEGYALARSERGGRTQFYHELSNSWNTGSIHFEGQSKQTLVPTSYTLYSSWEAAESTRTQVDPTAYIYAVLKPPPPKEINTKSPKVGF